MEKAIMELWAYVRDYWDDIEIDELYDEYELDPSMFRRRRLARLDEDEQEELFGTLVDIYMDVTDTDNYEDVFEVLSNIVSLDKEELYEVLNS